MPKSVDDLRSKTNPKISYEGRVLSGKGINQERTAMPNMEKYRPETAFELGSERWFTTKGAVTGNTQRPEQIIRNTKRKVSRPITGIAGPTNKAREPTRPKVKKSTKRNFKGSGPRNATASIWTNVDQGDYGLLVMKL